jgi:predicted metal-dependent peptidase
MSSGDIETKLAAARTRLVLDKPFLGALVLRLPLIVADPKWCQTTATDARGLFYNRVYIDALDLEQTKFVLAHEALHCALSHFNRRGHRDKHRWDIACDYAINPLLVADGLKPPPGALVLDEYAGMTAEEIYPYIKENSDEQTLDQHMYDSEDSRSDSGRQTPQTGGGQGEQPKQDDNDSGGSEGELDADAGGAQRPPPLSASERESLAIQWQQRLAGAAQQAQQAGKLGGSMARLVDHLLQPQLPWRMLLARYMTNVAREDYSFQRPSRREGAAILPSLKSAHIDVVIVLDTSGSIDDDEMREFASEVDAIKGQLGARITLLACDDHIAEGAPWTFEPWEQLAVPGRLQGRGGTKFTPPIEWAEKQDRQPDLLVYFTDAEGEFPKHEPAFPVLWLVKGKAKVPWGQRVQLN